VTYPSVRQYGDGPSPSCQVGDWVVTIDAHTGAYIVEGTGRDQAPCPISETRPTDVVRECAPYATPFADPAMGASRAYTVACRYLDAISTATYDPRVAWRLIDLWYASRMGWSSFPDFRASDEAKAVDLSNVEISPGPALFVADARRRDGSFILARASIIRSTCSADSLQRVAQSTWYVTISANGGNGIAYVVVVHDGFGFRILSSDV
jgi:hypothetical protein